MGALASGYQRPNSSRPDSTRDHREQLSSGEP